MEKVDVVNEEDEVIDQQPRRKCHQEGLLHRGSTVIVYRTHEKKELLMQRRSREKMSNPGKLCFTGGHLKAGTSYRDGARREYFEELYSGKEGDLELEELGKIRKSADDDHEFMKIFEAIDGGPFDPDNEEVEELMFYGKDKLSEMMETVPETFTETTLRVAEELDLT